MTHNPEFSTVAVTKEVDQKDQNVLDRIKKIQNSPMFTVRDHLIEVLLSIAFDNPDEAPEAEHDKIVGMIEEDDTPEVLYDFSQKMYKQALESGKVREALALANLLYMTHEKAEALEILQKSHLEEVYNFYKSLKDPEEKMKYLDNESDGFSVMKFGDKFIADDPRYLELNNDKLTLRVYLAYQDKKAAKTFAAFATVVEVLKKKPDLLKTWSPGLQEKIHNQALALIKSAREDRFGAIHVTEEALSLAEKFEKLGILSMDSDAQLFEELTK